MSLAAATQDLEDIINDILKDIPKFQKGNKTAAQRVRTATIRLAKLSKEWRRLSLASEKKPVKAKRSSKKKTRTLKTRKKR